MALSSSQGFRCPQCGARHVWVVDDCDVCGYRSEASLGWEREGKRRERNEARGCLWDWWWNTWLLGDLVEVLFWVGRGLFVVLRSIVSLWT